MSENEDRSKQRVNKEYQVVHREPPVERRSKKTIMELIEDARDTIIHIVNGTHGHPANERGLTTNQVRFKADLPPNTHAKLSSYLKDLARKGLITSQNSGGGGLYERQKRYFPSEQ